MKNKKLKSVIKFFLCLVISTGMWIGVKYHKHTREQELIARQERIHTPKHAKHTPSPLQQKDSYKTQPKDKQLQRVDTDTTEYLQKEMLDTTYKEQLLHHPPDSTN